MFPASRCSCSDLTFCARCYVRGDYRVRFPDVAPRRVAISKETLQLLETIMHYGDDWKKVAEHVGGRIKEECVVRFIKPPFKEQFLGSPDSEEVDSLCSTSPPQDDLAGEDNSFPCSPAKRRRLTPFADTSNPIMAQVAFRLLSCQLWWALRLLKLLLVQLWKLFLVPILTLTGDIWKQTTPLSLTTTVRMVTFLSTMVSYGVAKALSHVAVEALFGSNINSDPRHMETNCTSLPVHKDDYGRLYIGTDGSERNTDTLVESVVYTHQE